MIHKDLCNPQKTKMYSALRMQFHFLLARTHTWDGSIPLTNKQMARELECDVQSIQKFVKKGIQEGILSLVGDRLYFLKTVQDYKTGYVKHYPFLESTEFKAMSLHAQRFVLYILWYGINQPFKRPLSALYHSNDDYQGVLNLYSKAPLYEVLAEVRQFLNIEIFNENGIEKVRVSGLLPVYASQEALSNEGEALYLQNLLAEQYVDELVSGQSREEILKIKKQYFDTLQDVGMELFYHALDKLLSLQKLYDLNLRGEIGKYLRGILKDLEAKILPTLQRRILSVERAMDTISHTRNIMQSTAFEWMKTFKQKIETLNQCVYFIQSKLNPGEDNKEHQKEVASFPFYNWLEA